MPRLVRTLLSAILFCSSFFSTMLLSEGADMVEVKVKEQPRGETEREIFGKIARKTSNFKPDTSLDEIDAMFYRFSNGKDVWERSSLSHKAQGEVFTRISADLNIENGQITRKQFRFYADQNLREDNPKMWRQPPPDKQEKQEKKAEKAEAKIEAKPVDSATQSPGAKREGEDEKQVVWRYGHLPSGLPEWFVKLDTDKDGQVGLYEWREAARMIDEFIKMDLNEDGLLTAQEWFEYARMQGVNVKTDSKSQVSRK